MLDAYHGEWNKQNAHGFAAHSLDELYELVDRLAAVRPVSSYGRGVSDHHAWLIVKNVDFSLAAHFGEGDSGEVLVDFLLYGPCPSGAERERAHLYDGRCLAGSMTTACLKGLLALLDEGRSPVDYVRDSALEADVVTD